MCSLCLKEEQFLKRDYKWFLAILLMFANDGEYVFPHLVCIYNNIHGSLNFCEKTTLAFFRIIILYAKHLTFSIYINRPCKEDRSLTNYYFHDFFQLQVHLLGDEYGVCKKNHKMVPPQYSDEKVA